MQHGSRRRRANFPATGHLERWIDLQADRRGKLAELLATKTMTPGLRAKLKAWSLNLDTKKVWLQARLEHLEATKKILDNATNDSSGQ
jgi:hypothetical protein